MLKYVDHIKSFIENEQIEILLKWEALTAHKNIWAKTNLKSKFP
jgi:hypothetical protein